MRILAIAPTGFFADYGCHVRIRGQLTALAARGHTVRLVTYPSGRDVDRLPTVRPLRTLLRGHEIPVGSSRRKLLLDAALAPATLAAALSFPGGRPQIIHAYLHEGALLGALLSSLLRTPLVFDFQGSLTAEMLDHRFLRSTSPLLPWLRRLEQWIDRRPHAILASSAHAERLLVERFGVTARRVHTLPDSVDPVAFRPRSQFDPQQVDALRRLLGVPVGRPLVVYLGLLAPYQGTELLLSALRQTVDRRQHAAPHGLIMGFPDVVRYTRLAEEMGLAGHVTFTGAVPYEQAPLHLVLGDVAVAPKLSATEGSGKLLTYMATALPVVAFDTPVHREYLGDEGYYAVPGDATALAAALDRVLDAPVEAAERGRRLRRRVETAYTWQHAAQQIEEVYRRLGVAEPPPCRPL